MAHIQTRPAAAAGCEDVETVHTDLVRRPFDEVVRETEQTLHRHGFVPAATLDLQRELLEGAGAHLRPYVILAVVSLATTLRMLRRDPAAADRAVLLVTIRDTGDGVALSLSPPSGANSPDFGPVIADLRRRLMAALAGQAGSTD